MKEINAVWEKRNLGVSCTELEFTRGDTVDCVPELSRAQTSEYLVAKVPVGMSELGYALQAEGFAYAETNFRLTKTLSALPELPELYRRYAPRISYHPANPSGQMRILDKIAGGGIFTTDKVACDPFFSPALSGRRYALWTKDLLEQGIGRAFLLCYREQEVGFCVNVRKDGFYDAFLGGLFPEAQDTGLGFATIYANLHSIYLAGGRKVVTGVSSNNPSILRLHMLYGFTIGEMAAIYIKHQKGSEA